MSTLAVLPPTKASPPSVTVNVAVSARSSEMLGVELIVKLTFASESDGLIEMSVELPAEWVDETLFRMPKLTSWAEDNAERVFRRRQDAVPSSVRPGTTGGRRTRASRWTDGPDHRVGSPRRFPRR